MSKKSNLKVRILVVATILVACGTHVLAEDKVISDGQGATWDDSTSTLKIKDSISFNKDTGVIHISMPQDGGNLDATSHGFLLQTTNFSGQLTIDNKVGQIKTKNGLVLSSLAWGSRLLAASKADLKFLFSSIDSISLSGETSKNVYGGCGIFLADGIFRSSTSYTAVNSSFNQIIGNTDSKIGKLVTDKPGKGFGIALVENTYPTFQTGDSLFANQVVNASIGAIGSEASRFNVGIFKLSKDFISTNNKKGASSYQEVVGKIGKIYATEAGIVYYSGLGEDTSKFHQHISEVGVIDIDSSSSDTIYPVIAGISTQSGSSGKAPTDNFGQAAQVVGISEGIKVEGGVAHDKTQLVKSNIRKNNTNPALDRSNIEKYIARIGISNFGGTQLIQAKGDVVKIDVGTKNSDDLFNFAVLVYPELDRLGISNTIYENRTFVYTAPIVSTLEGNFAIGNGHVGVLGLMPQHKKNVTEKPLFENISSELKFLASEHGNTLRLGGNSKFFVTNRRWSELEQAFDIGSKGGNSTLTVGNGSSIENNYRVILPSAQNSLYVDGDFRGNATFVVGSSWNAKKEIVEVHQTPLVFRNIVKQDDGSATHLNVDVDVSGSVPANKIDQFNKDNALCVMNEAIQNLVIGSGKENLELGGFDTDLGTAIDNNFAIDKNLALKNPDASGVAANQRKATGYVSVSTYEGLITPKTTYYSKYYLDDTKGTDKDMNALLSKVEGEVKNIAQSMYSETSAQSDEVPEDISNAYGGAGVGSVVSDKELSQNFASIDNPGTEDPDTPPKDPETPTDPAAPDEPGENKPQKTTSTMDSIDSLGMANYFIWRQENETLYQRLGEVRDDPSARGLWVKVRGGRNKYSEAGNYFKNQYYGVQLGLDRPLDEEWTLGAAASYTYGDGKLTNGGKDDNWIASGSIYALGAFDDGSYLDVVLRASRIHNDFTVVSDQARYITKGKRSGNAYSASVEYGQKIPLNPNWYVDPQIQVTYGHIQGLSFTTKNGVKVNTDRVNSLIGRVGVGVGYENAKGGAFVRADVLRDFTAQYKTNYALEKAKNNSDIDLRSTWGEISVGGNYQFDKNLHGYAQAKRSVGGKLKQDYRLDFGLRYVF